MPSIVRDGTYRIYVYGSDHRPPHCHVRWGGSQEAVVNLNPLLQVRGDVLPRAGRILVQAHRAELQAAWEQLNH